MRTLLPDVNYAFSPSLLDAFETMNNTKLEDYFYQDESGAWHKNYNEEDGTFHLSDAEMHERLKKEFLDKVNKVPQPPSEAASKGTAFNEIVDCLVLNRKPENPKVVIKTIRSGDDLFSVKPKPSPVILPDNTTRPDEAAMNQLYAQCMEQYSKIGMPFIYAAIDGFEFLFDKNLCMDAAEYHKNSLCQYYTAATLQTSKGLVELHGYIDYLRENKIFDAKTSKKYDFGNYMHRWQRYTYPYTMIESGLMDAVSSFEFTIYKLTGGGPRSPLITGERYMEEYTYDHEQAKQMLVAHCEQLIDFLEANRESITNLKVFGIEDADNRQD